MKLKAKSFFGNLISKNKLNLLYLFFHVIFYFITLALKFNFIQTAPIQVNCVTIVYSF